MTSLARAPGLLDSSCASLGRCQNKSRLRWVFGSCFFLAILEMPSLHCIPTIDGLCNSVPTVGGLHEAHAEEVIRCQSGRVAISRTCTVQCQREGGDLLRGCDQHLSSIRRSGV